MAFTEHCVTCLYYASTKDVGTSLVGYSGECRRYAPYGQGTQFPSVDVTDWCGEHPKNTLPKELVELEPEDPKDNVLTGFATSRGGK